MNQSIYTSAYYSLVIQFIIAIICLLGTFIKVDNQDKILREVLVLETVVQFIEFSFYLWLVYNFNNIKIDISVVRYYDWFLTTPTMLFALICFMVYFHKTPENNSTTEEMSLENIYHENSSIIHKILVSNALMLLLGYLGELNIISKVTGFLGGTFFLLYAFYYLYVTFVQEHSINKYLFWRGKHSNVSDQGQSIIDSPNVAGWPAFYQGPLYHEYWISSVTLPMRTNQIKSFLSNNGIRGFGDGLKIVLQPLDFLLSLENPKDINFVIDLLCKWLFPVFAEISDSTKSELIEIVVGGNPNIWEDELNEYLNDPSEDKKEDINKKLRLLIKEMCLMPEYYLS